MKAFITVAVAMLAFLYLNQLTGITGTPVEYDYMYGDDDNMTTTAAPMNDSTTTSTEPSDTTTENGTTTEPITTTEPANFTTTFEPANETTTIEPANATTTVEPDTTTQPITTTTAKPSSSGSSFDGLSFFGGIVLGVGVIAIAWVAYKIYHRRVSAGYKAM